MAFVRNKFTMLYLMIDTVHQVQAEFQLHLKLVLNYFTFITQI